MKRLALLLAPLVLSACQNGPETRPGERSNTATLIFTSDRIAAQPMICRPGEGFVPTEEAMAATALDPEAAFDPDKVRDDEGRVAVNLPAGSGVTVGVRFEPSGNEPGPDACRVSADFTPGPGGLYQAEFVMAGDHCGLAISDFRNRAVASGVQGRWACPGSGE